MLDLVGPEQVVERGGVKGIQGQFAAHDDVSLLGGKGIDDLRARGPFQPGAGAPVGLHIHFDAAQALGAGTSRLQFRKAGLKSLKGDIDDLDLAPGVVQQGLEVVDNVPLFQLIGNVLIHCAPGTEKVVLGLNEHNSGFFGRQLHGDLLLHK